MLDVCKRGGGQGRDTEEVGPELHPKSALSAGLYGSGQVPILSGPACPPRCVTGPNGLEMQGVASEPSGGSSLGIPGL